MERSNDSQAFDPIVKINGNGTTSGFHQYQFIDNLVSPAANPLYYRLKQVDLDGRIHYSKIIMLNLQNAGRKISIYPIPAKGKIQLSISNNEENLVLKIYDMAGHMLWSNAYNHINRITPIDISRLPLGVYKLAMEKSNGEINVVSFSKE